MIIAALDGTYERKPFDNVSALIPLAERITKLHALCKCGREAPFSKRIVSSEETILIGGEESYQPACRACYFD